jgi:hypothetical protein
MSKYLAPLPSYEQVRAERRKLKGKSPPREPRMVALAEKDVPADVLRDIRSGEMRRQAFAQAQAANGNPHEIFRGKPL